MKKILLLLLITIVICCSCGNNKHDYNSDYDTLFNELNEASTAAIYVSKINAYILEEDAVFANEDIEDLLSITEESEEWSRGYSIMSHIEDKYVEPKPSEEDEAREYLYPYIKQYQDDHKILSKYSKNVTSKLKAFRKRYPDKNYGELLDYYSEVTEVVDGAITPKLYECSKWKEYESDLESLRQEAQNP